jgi:hypothetical protein
MRFLLEMHRHVEAQRLGGLAETGIKTIAAVHKGLSNREWNYVQEWCCCC